jgi:hypothetical protein
VPTPPRPLRRSGAVLAVLAPLVALWLGLTAPNTSPVQPAPAVQQAADPAAGADQAVPPPAGRRGGRP